MFYRNVSPALKLLKHLFVFSTHFSSFYCFSFFTQLLPPFLHSATPGMASRSHSLRFNPLVLVLIMLVIKPQWRQQCCGKRNLVFILSWGGKTDLANKTWRTRGISLKRHSNLWREEKFQQTKTSDLCGAIRRLFLKSIHESSGLYFHHASLCFLLLQWFNGTRQN